MFGKKSIKSPEGEAFINKLAVSPEIKRETRAAFYRQIEDKYTDNKDGFTRKFQDLQLIKDATTLGLGSLRDTSNVKYGGDYVMMNGPAAMGGGYAPAGSILRRLYPNEFTLHSFLCEAYWASVKSRRELYVDTDRDGYALIAAPTVAKKNIKLINDVIIEIR